MSWLFALGGLNYWSFNISPSNEYSEKKTKWIFRVCLFCFVLFRIDWFDLAVQGALKSLLQHYNLKASIVWCSAFFMVQLSHLHMTIRKNIALTLVNKVLSLFLNMLSRFPSKDKVYFNYMVAVTIHCALEPKKIQSVTVSTFFCYEVMWLDAMILVFWMMNLSQLFHSLLSLSSRGSFTSSSFSAIRVASST